MANHVHNNRFAFSSSAASFESPVASASSASSRTGPNPNRRGSNNLNLLYRTINEYNTNVNLFNQNMRTCLIHVINDDVDNTNMLSNVSYEIYRTFLSYNENMNTSLNLIRNMNENTPTYNPSVEFTYTLFPTFTQTNTVLQDTSNNLLTQEEINTLTETFNFTSAMESTTCPISLEPFNINDEIKRILYCGHCFKNNALLRWFTRSTCCPVCRYNLKNTRPNHIRLPFPSNVGVGETPTSSARSEARSRTGPDVQTNIPNLRDMAFMSSPSGEYPDASTSGNGEINRVATILPIPLSGSMQSLNSDAFTESIEQLLGNQIQTLLDNVLGSDEWRFENTVQDPSGNVTSFS